jgi:hypothetical protein
VAVEGATLGAAPTEAAPPKEPSPFEIQKHFPPDGAEVPFVKSFEDPNAAPAKEPTPAAEPPKEPTPAPEPAKEPTPAATEEAPAADAPPPAEEAPAAPAEEAPAAE